MFFPLSPSLQLLFLIRLTFVFVWEQDQNNCRLFGHCGYYVLKGPFGPLVFLTTTTLFPQFLFFVYSILWGLFYHYGGIVEGLTQHPPMHRLSVAPQDSVEYESQLSYQASTIVSYFANLFNSPLPLPKVTMNMRKFKILGRLRSKY